MKVPGFLAALACALALLAQPALVGVAGLAQPGIAVAAPLAQSDEDMEEEEDAFEEEDEDEGLPSMFDEEAPPRTVPAGPGQGGSSDRPSGAPVNLRLPPGYSLLDIRGGATEGFFEQCLGSLIGGAGEVPAFCRQVRGPFQVTLRLQFDPVAADAALTQRAASTVVAQEPMIACLTNPPSTLWTGWVLVSGGGDAQNIWVPVYSCLADDGTYTPILDLPREAPSAGVGDEGVQVAASQSPRIVEVTLGGYCLNASRSAPGEENAYDVGVLSDDPELGRILAALEGKQLHRFENHFAIQEIIWKHTDGEGITEADLATLRALP